MNIEHRTSNIERPTSNEKMKQRAEGEKVRGLEAGELRGKQEDNMPKLKEIDINYEQVRDLVYQLAFEKKMALIKEIVKDRRYQENFYRFTESLVKKYDIPKMNESELDAFLS